MLVRVDYFGRLADFGADGLLFQREETTTRPDAVICGTNGKVENKLDRIWDTPKRDRKVEEEEEEAKCRKRRSFNR